MNKRRLAVISMAFLLIISITACSNSGGNAGSVQQTSREEQLPQDSSIETESSGETIERTDNEPAGSKSDNMQSGQFDERLGGSWHMVSEEHAGDLDVDMGLNFHFLYDGRFYGRALFDYHEVATKGLECPRTVASGDTLDLLDKAFEFMEINGDTFDVADFDASTYSITVSYELSDIEKSLSRPDDDWTAHYYAKYDNDMLTLHIMGNYQESLTDVQTIDSTFVYEKRYPIYQTDDYILPSLEGKWIDNNGNVWEFFYLVDRYAVDSEIDPIQKFKFKATEASGKEHEGLFINRSWDKDDPECKEFITFSFSDSYITPKCEIVSYDGETLILDQGEDEDIVLSRRR